MKNIKIKKFIRKITISILVIVLVVVLPLTGIKYSDDMVYIYDAFVGKKSEYEGIIEVWNIDSFESGYKKKSEYIEKVAKLFQKQNRGLYILVRNITENECINLLNTGEKPDIFSCSYNVAKKIEKYVVPFSNMENIDVLKQFLDAGKINEKQYAIPWCVGVYCLISTEDNLNKAGIDYDENTNLSDIAFNAGYEKIGKKDKKTIYSLSIGTNGYLMAEKALKAYNNINISEKNELSVDMTKVNQSQYSAYVDFLSEKCSILLGTQRDIIKIDSRIENGKISDVIMQPLVKYTDLIQFLFISDKDNVKRGEYAQLFVKTLTSKSSQTNLGEIGLFPVTGQVDVVYNTSIMCDIIHKINEICDVKNIFE